MIKIKYRVVTDNFAGFEVQHKHWWWPFWEQSPGISGGNINTWKTLGEAKAYAKKLSEKGLKSGRVVWEEYTDGE